MGDEASEASELQASADEARGSDPAAGVGDIQPTPHGQPGADMGAGVVLVAREPRDYVVLVNAHGTGRKWVELGKASGRNRAEALEDAEEKWPGNLLMDDSDEVEPLLEVHLIPERFWRKITPEPAPPKPPKRRWEGV